MIFSSGNSWKILYGAAYCTGVQPIYPIQYITGIKRGSNSLLFSENNLIVIYCKNTTAAGDPADFWSEWSTGCGPLKGKIAKRTLDTAGAPDTSNGFCSEINSTKNACSRR
jgi:hypothetical protein